MVSIKQLGQKISCRFRTKKKNQRPSNLVSRRWPPSSLPLLLPSPSLEDAAGEAVLPMVEVGPLVVLGLRVAMYDMVDTSWSASALSLSGPSVLLAVSSKHMREVRWSELSWSQG
jgi:hypothetical protein